MSGLSTLRDRAEALREGIEELLLEEVSRGAAAHLRDAETLVSRFCELGASEGGVLALDDLRTALDHAMASLGEQAETSRADGTPQPESGVTLLEEAIAWASELRARALDELAAVAPVGPISRNDLPFGFRASKGSPAVHEAKDVPPLDLLAKSRAWTDPDDDEEAEEEARKAAELAATPLHAGLVRVGRDTMEDIGILGGLRRLGDDEPWGDAEAFEDCLLANLDLLWALDAPAHDDVPRLGVPRALFRYAMEWATPDWGRAFALSFGLGCSSSEAALRWVVLAMRRAATPSLDAFVHGLALASSPHVDRTVSAELRTEAPPELLAALLEIARRRRAFELSAVVPLLAHPALVVKVAALGAMQAAPREVAIASCLEMISAADAPVAIQAAEELARRGHPSGLEHLKGVLKAPPSEASGPSLGDTTLALRAIALAGHAKDEALVVEHALARDDGAVWLSFYGRPSVVPLIIGIIDKTRKAGAGQGLEVLRAERAFNRVTGLDPFTDAPGLSAAFETSGLAAKAPRLRGGEAYLPRAVVAELASGTSGQGERRILARELGLLCPDAPPIDVEGFTAQQLALLASIETS